MIAWLVAIGLVSMLGQVVLLRELNVAFFGSELIYILCLGVWMFWTAVGAAIGRRSRLPPPGRVRALLLLLGVVLPLAVVLVRGLRLLFGGVPGAYLPFPRQLFAMALALLPVSVCLGLLFQWAAKLYIDKERTLAAAYAIESAGAMVGGVLATLLLKWGLQNLAAALLCALYCVLAAALPRRPARSPIFLAGAALLTVTLGVLLAWSRPVDEGMTAWNHPALAATGDSPYGRVTVTETSGQLSVFENDALAFESEGTAAEEFAHLAALQHPAPRRILVLGGGVEGLVTALLLHRPEHLDAVELNPVLIRLVTPLLDRADRQALEAGPVRFTIADPRRFLNRPGSYDLILVGMPEPESGQANRFYTREFFARCRQRLAADGVLAFRLRGAENLWTPNLARRTTSIHRALSAVFTDVVVLPATTNVFLASSTPLPRDPSILAERLDTREIRARLVIPAYLDYLYTTDRYAEIASLLDGGRAPVNSDLRPICYQYTLLIWLSRFFPTLALLDFPEFRLLDAVRSPVFWIGCVVVLGGFLLSRRVDMGRRALLAAVAGLAGMVLETVLLLQYQTRRGVLFQDLGLLLTLFMTGLAGGAAVLDRLVPLVSRRRGLTWLTGAGCLAGLAALSLVTAGRIRAGAVEGLGETAVLMLATGFLVAALFAYTSLQRRPDQRAVVSPLYAADLLGGSLGSLAASLVLIPMLGLPASAALLALLLLLSVMLL
jgi:spermidine synthase